MITKDASSYNIQFVGAQPTFIDIGSFERIRKGEPWYGYRQFCQLFLYPLMLEAFRDVPFQPWLRGSIDGITPEECRNTLSVRARFRRGAFSTVLMHARADVKHADSDRDVKDEMSRAGMGPALIAAMVSKLHKTVDRLTWSKSSTTWSDYSDRAHYSDADLQLKSEFVGKVAAASRASWCGTSEPTTPTSPGSQPITPTTSWPSTLIRSSSTGRTRPCATRGRSGSSPCS